MIIKRGRRVGDGHRWPVALACLTTRPPGMTSMMVQKW